MPAKISDEEYDNRIASGWGKGSMKEFIESPEFKILLAENRNDFGAAMRAAEVKKEKFPTVDGWFLGSIPEWNFNAKELSGKTTLIVATAQGDVLEKKIQGTPDPRWGPMTKVSVGPLSRSTFLLKEADDPKRVQLSYKEAQVKAAEHEAAFPEILTPGAADAIRFASGLKTKGRITVRGKANDVVLHGRITDDPSQISYRSGGDYEESLTVPVISSDGAVVQVKFKGEALYSPSHVAKVFGIDADEEAFKDKLPNAIVLGIGSLGLTMPWEPLKQGNEQRPANEVAQYVQAMRDGNFLKKETYENKVYERLDLKGKKDDSGQPLKAVVFCGKEIVDLEIREKDGQEWPVANVLMTDQPGKYPWFSPNPGQKDEDDDSDRPASNSAGFFLFVEQQLADEVEVKRDDAASRAAERWAKYASPQ